MTVPAPPPRPPTGKDPAHCCPVCRNRLVLALRGEATLWCRKCKRTVTLKAP